MERTENIAQASTSPARNDLRRAGLTIAVILTLAPLLGLGALHAQESPEVSATTGPSWLDVTRRSFDATSMGRIGHLGAESAIAPDSPPTLAQVIEQGFSLDGQDLFRYNCRSCHGAGGAGLPPEIKPLTAGIKATSIQIQQRVQEAGIETGSSPRQAASRADEALHGRLAEGGAAMPAFDHLSADAVETLLAYLEELAEIPDPRRSDRPVAATLVEVGESIVKGTCHHCHAGATPPSQRDPEITPLDGMVARHAIEDFYRQGRHQTDPGTRRSRGPLLSYFRDSELAAVYLYLAAYPPEP